MSWLMYQGEWDEELREENRAARERSIEPTDCAASREAVEEAEDNGELGCPVCGCPSYAHRSEYR